MAEYKLLVVVADYPIFVVADYPIFNLYRYFALLNNEIIFSKFC